uniref:Uncharacterized protein n=1 Tax=Candidatus Kentrum sp. FW TaxID=2126338 RepID=A0A450TMN2_9GAMM|nr:MAG: hypothetical protein BECKFW1821C_GA0114237_101713 [Candidatus Kentron sp. FW]
MSRISVAVVDGVMDSTLFAHHRRDDTLAIERKTYTENKKSTDSSTKESNP